MKRFIHCKYSRKSTLITIIAVALLGGTAAYIYFQNHTKSTPVTHPTDVAEKSQAPTSNQSTARLGTSKSTDNQSTTSLVAGYFTIKEWGVHAPYDGSLTLQYVENGSSSLSLSSSQLAAGGPAACSAAGNSDAGILSRYLPTDASLEPGIPANENAEQYIEQNATVPHVKIGDYIYIYWGNNYLTNGAYNGPCTDKTAGMQTISAFSTLVPKLQALKK